MTVSLPLVFNAPRRGKPPRHLADLDADERKEAVKELGLPGFRADQLARQYYGRLEADADKMTDLPAGMREKVGAALFPRLLDVVKHVACDAGQTRKTLWKANDGTLLESVLMRYPDRATLCISSQAGCGMACPFCATGQGGLARNHSTAEIETTRRLADILKQHGMSFIDAPVSGGPGAAEAGTLAIMAGGDDDAIAKVTPVMQHLGNFTHMGKVGAGQATKLVNQTLVLTNYCVIAEALRVAETYGIEASRIPQALASGHAGSNLLPVLLKRMIARDWTPTGYARQVLKDLEMLNEAARGRHLAMPMAAQALTLFRMLAAQGKSELDGSAILEVLPPGDEPS